MDYLVGDQISRSSKFKYRMLSSYNSERTVRTNCMQTNKHQFTAENSVLSSICYLFTIAINHYLIGPPDTLIERVTSSKLRKGATLFFQVGEHGQQQSAGTTSSSWSRYFYR